MQSSELNSWLAAGAWRPLVMGVLNVTPDSFSDGGKFIDAGIAAEHALAMEAAGADIIDIGGESSRPGATAVLASEQICRIVPVMEIIRRQSTIGLSIDTTSWQVARAALDAGADWINDISAGRDDPALLPGVAAAGVPIILMHRLGMPPTMQQNPAYADVTAEVTEFLRLRLAAAESAGIDPARVLLDPGIGFGKTAEHNLTLLRELSSLVSVGRPVVIGASRKSFIAKVLNQPDPARRIWGDAAIISWAIANGAAVLRVHDVEPMAQVARMTRALMGKLEE